MQWKEQLNKALGTFTTSGARRLVDACGDSKALDAWRLLSDRGCSMRLAHANVLRRQAFNPKTSVPTKDLEASIAKWEADIEVYKNATGETVPEPHRHMSLEDMCPERLTRTWR